MALINENFIKIPETYIFSEIAKRISNYKKENPDAEIIKMGIGDVTLPLPDVSVEAIVKATKEQADSATFRGYGPEQGYEFLRQIIVENEYKNRNIDIDASEVFVSDGAKSDTGNIGDIFDVNNHVAITDPSYPVYVDTNAMAGRAGSVASGGIWSALYYLPCNESNHFVPALPTKKVDLIYLCYPNNPTGTTLTIEQLAEWVQYAKDNESVILFDAAYESFIREPNVPHSIYEVPDAKDVAIEFRSFSKNAGFTGTRAGYTVVPKNLFAHTKQGERISLHRLWLRRQTTKFNGTAYIIQRGAEAIYSDAGKKQVKDLTDYYMNNATLIKTALEGVGLKVYGGVNAPYLWTKTPNGMSSWEYFDYLLKEKNIVCTPGVGFGPNGEGFVRFSAFGNHEQTIKAMERIQR